MDSPSPLQGPVLHNVIVTQNPRPLQQWLSHTVFLFNLPTGQKWKRSEPCGLSPPESDTLGCLEGHTRSKNNIQDTKQRQYVAVSAESSYSTDFKHLENFCLKQMTHYRYRNIYLFRRNWFMQLWKLNFTGQDSRLETQAGVDFAALRQNLFSGKLSFYFLGLQVFGWSLLTLSRAVSFT